MAFYPKLDQQNLAVGVIEQVIVAPFTGRGEQLFLLVIENLSLTETFTAQVWASPNGVTQWTKEADDAFVDMSPGTSRRVVIGADRIWARVLGNFVGGPGSIRITAFLLNPLTWVPNTI